ncbi:hypothetical protein OF83DRAFT_1175887 [Amylostereum chailletii]|nr:hypothetical protein OF83DRAFT_1175887 [Amylostereum chailletii]
MSTQIQGSSLQEAPGKNQSGPHPPTPPPTRPLLFRHLHEHFDDEDTGDFLSTVLTWTDGAAYFWASLPERAADIDPDGPRVRALSQTARPVPLDFYQQPSPYAWYRRARSPLPDDCFVKRTEPFLYHPSFADLCTNAVLMQQEARNYERIAACGGCRHLCGYEGYVADEYGWMVGLCLRRYGKDLWHAVVEGDPVDVEKVLRGLKAGLEHLHYIGLVHNDIKPTNIVLDDDGEAVIIDFDACLPEGSGMGIKGGTPDWCRQDVDLSTADNDWYAYDKVAEWLRDACKDPSLAAPDEEGSRRSSCSKRALSEGASTQ